MISMSGGGETRRLVHERTRRTPRAVVSLFTALSLVLGVLATLVVAATPASAIPAAVSTTRTVSGFPRWYADQAGTRVEPCIDGSDPFCVLVTNPPIFDSTQPTVWPTNFPDEFFYQITDSDIITTPGCAGTAPGKALMRVALEGTFANTTGIATPGQQIVFGRVRFNVTSGLCPNTPYTFTYPYGSVTFTTDATGSLARKDGTTDVGCGAATIGGCDFTLALPSTVLTKFLRWDPAVAPAAPAGYLGDPAVLHPITGAPTGNNFFRITGGTTPALQTNLFTVSGKIAGPLQSAPETLDAGAQPINIPSTPRTITITNVGPAPLTVASVAVSPAGTPWTLNATTCAGTIAVDASCTATLTFAPTVIGPANASLVITHNQVRSPTTIPLVGSGTTAVAPSVTISPLTLGFGRVLVGTTGGPIGAVIRNNGPGTYNIASSTVVDSTAGAVGDSAAFLPITANDCPATGLLAGTSCTVSVSFKPTVQKPYAATLQINGAVGTTAVNLSAPATGLGGLATSSTGLDGLGPDGLGVGPFPTWYQDDRGVRLSQCINPADVNCIVLADPTFNPALPVAFPGNYPSEAFFYVTDSDLLTTPGCGVASPPGKASFRAATEQTFMNGTPVLADAMVFGRIRVFATSGLCPGQQYTFVHPYGTFTFTADDLGGLKRPDGTQDVGCVPAPTVPCNFNNAVLSPVSDGYLRWDTTLPAPPAGYLGDAATLHTVAGAPYVEPGASTPANYVKILDSAGNIVAQTNLFTVMGKIDPTQTATRFQTVAPKAVTFADQATATTSAARTITVESVGTTPLTVTGVTVTGANAADFTVATNTCGVQAVATRCSITVTFRPGAAGLRTATLSIASNVTNTWTGSVPLSGTGIGVAPPTPVLTAAPTSLTFANQLVATTSAPQAVTITNTGTANLTLSAATLGGTNPGDFALTNGCAAAVVPGGTCTLAVTFRPTAAGARAGSLAITSDGGTATIALAGTGTAPVQTVTPLALTFAPQVVGTPSAAQNVTVTNTGTAPLTVQTLTIVGADVLSYTFVNNCTTLIGGASCTIPVTFTPAATGVRDATLTITSNGGTTNVSITGTGLAAPVAVLSAAPAALTFASQTLGTTSAVQNVTVTNTGTANLTVSGVTVGGVNAADFAATNGCTVAVAPAATCTIGVTFTPAAVGARAGSVSIASNGGTATVTLSGTGAAAAAPVLSAAPTALTFASQTVGTTSAVQNVTVTNTGNAPLTVSGVTVGGVNPADFAATNGCTVAVAPAATCTIGVRFTPAAAGARAGSVSIASNGGTATVTLSGTGAAAAAPVLSAAPTALTFPSQTVGLSSLRQNVTVTNTGNAPLTVSGVTVGGVNAADFTVTNGCTVAVAAAGTCTIGVTFTPTAAGARTGSVSIASNGGTATVTLTGTGATAPTPITFTLNPAVLTFPSANVGASSTAGSFLTVSGQTGTVLPTLTITGPDAAMFSATACFGPVFSFGVCPLQVTFRPTSGGIKTATLTISAPGGALNVPLTATAIGAAAPVLSAAPTALTFASQTVATTSAAQNITVTNTGNANLTVSGVTVGGLNAADFAATNGCTVAVLPGATCTIAVRFTPAAGGARTGSVTIASNGGTSTVSLSGTGSTVALTLSTPAFPSTTVGTTSSSFSIVTAVGQAAPVLPTLSITGVDAAQFSTTQCTVALASGGLCLIAVTFAPTSAGTKTATLTVSAPGAAPVSVPLTGVATAPPVLTAINGARSVFSNPLYSATVSSTAYTGNSLVVAFSATGPADLVRPEGTCITITQPNGVTVLRRPASVSLTTNLAGNFAGTMTFTGLAVGTVDLQYGCLAGYSLARIGTLATPPAGTYWNANGEQSIYSPNTVYRATFTSSSVAGGNLTVAFSATGLADLVRPEGTCLVITAANGTTRTLAPTTALTTNLAGNFAGTFTFTGVTAGTFQLQYGCFAGYTQARIGFLA